MVCLSGFELYSRWVPLTIDGTHLCELNRLHQVWRRSLICKMFARN